MNTVLLMFLLCSTSFKFGEACVFDKIKPQCWDKLTSIFDNHWTKVTAIRTYKQGKPLECSFRIRATKNEPAVCVQIRTEPVTDWGCDNPTETMPSDELAAIASFMTPTYPGRAKPRPIYCKEKNTIYIAN